MDKRERQDRTKGFALRVLKLVDALPRTAAGRDFNAACSRSHVCWRKLSQRVSRAITCRICGQAWNRCRRRDESLYWLKLVRDGKLVPEYKLSLLLKEAGELTAIL